MLAHLAGEVQEGEVLHPVIVVHQFGVVGRVRIEVQELGQLFLHAGNVALQGFLVQQVTLLRLAGGVANHARGTADERQRLVSATLEVAQDHHAAQMADVEGIGRRVKTDVSSHLFLGQQLFRAGHHVVEHATPS